LKGIELLLAHGADPNARTGDDATPLEEAERHGRVARRNPAEAQTALSSVGTAGKDARLGCGAQDRPASY
jgi:ankyrin repeat protein